MATFRFFTSVCDYGVLEVEADNLEQAESKAHQLDGIYTINSTEMLDIILIPEQYEF
jgi:hypothetical protein